MNRYTVPYVNVSFTPTYNVLSSMGYAQIINIKDVWPDTLTDQQAQNDDNKKIGIGTQSTTTAQKAGVPPQTTDPNVLVPTLWLDVTTGWLLLRPNLFTASRCSFLNSVIWKKGDIQEKDPNGATPYLGKGSQTDDTSTHPLNALTPSVNVAQQSQVNNQWYPLKGSEYTNFWKEDTFYFTRANNDTTVPGVVALKADYDQIINSQNNTWEHLVASKFTLEENASFAFTIQPTYPIESKNTVQTDTDEVKTVNPSYLRIYWGKGHVLELNVRDRKLRYGYEANTQTGNGLNSGNTLIEVTGIAIPTPEKPETLVVQVVGNAVVINNAEDLSPKHSKTAKAGWAYTFKDDASLKNGLTVPADTVYVGVRNAKAKFAYIPVYYSPQGTLSSKTIGTGASLTNIKSTLVVLPVGADQQNGTKGGEVDYTQTVGGDATNGTFQFKVTLKQDNLLVNRSPQLFGIRLKSDPGFVGIPTTSNVDPALLTCNINSRVRSLSLTHGILEQNGTLVVDNRDGAFKNTVAVLPIAIDVGWYDTSGTLTSGPRFRGFCTGIEIDKKAAPYSTATFSLTGRIAQLKDAIAVNLPPYDGMVHIDAITDLVARGGWASTQPDVTGSTINVGSNGSPFFTDPTYRLQQPGSLNGEPLYFFTLGKAIWSCIEEIQRATFFWAYVDSLGVFNYVPPFKGNLKGTFKEVPTLGNYDEWLSLETTKLLGDIKNAVMVVSLDASYDTPKYLTSTIRAIGPVGVGDPAGQVGSVQTSTSSPQDTQAAGGVNFIPWYRWILISDSKLNSQEVVDRVARRTFDNNNRPRWVTKGRVWGTVGQNMIFPLDSVKLKLNTDQINLPGGDDAMWRVLSVTDEFNAEDKTYFNTLELEYIDPRFSYAAWWGRD